MASESASVRPEWRPANLGAKVIAGVVVVPAFVAGFFWLAGRFDWIAGWACLGLLTLGLGGGMLYVWRRDPELVRRRGGVGEGVPAWDKVVLGLFQLSYCGDLVVAPLDAVRYRWSIMSGWLWPVGAVMFLVFVVLVTWAMSVNTHFETLVRIQTDRGHTVIDTGPYRLVRHPGYAGTILGLCLATPLLLGSWWAFVPGVIAGMVLVVRTALEGRFLRAGLPGYEDYARRVHYRLLPGVW